ncbi:MAG: OadG family transporter subunit [Thiolinea sp.]
MQDTLIGQGFSLMLYGMGVVFAFLTLLVYTTAFMSKLVARWFPPLPEAPAPVRKKRAAPAAVSPLTLKIIQAAINEHRSRSN